MSSFNFASGQNQIPAYGRKSAAVHLNTWTAGDLWTFSLATTAGNATLGVGRFGTTPAGPPPNGAYLSSIAPSCLFVYRDRVYLGNTSQFNFSDNGDPTGWEVQNSGSGSISYVTSFGSEDIVEAFSQLQGRVAVFGRRSIQLWTTDGDPNNFAWIQTLDNSGTQAPLSVVNLGDYDCIYLDDSGVRSLRAKEVTSNAFIDDIGSAIDGLIQAISQGGGSPTLACSVVDPLTKNYWLSIPTGATNTATIFVLSRHPAVKQTAWSTYNATYMAHITPGGNYDVNGHADLPGGTTIGVTYHWLKGANDISITCGSTTLTTSGPFTATDTAVHMVGTALAGITGEFVNMTPVKFIPTKFVVYQGLIYALGNDASGLRVWQYGGANGNQYDGTPVTAQLPWLDDKRPDSNKKAQGIQWVAAGQWSISVGMDPKTSLTQIISQYGSATAPSSLTDSSYDVGRFGVELQGTHFSVSLTSSNQYGLTLPAVFSSLSFSYNLAEGPL